MLIYSHWNISNGYYDVDIDEFGNNMFRPCCYLDDVLKSK